MSLAHYLLPRSSNNHKSKVLQPSALLLLIGVFTLSQLVISSPRGPNGRVLGFASNISADAVVTLTNQKRSSLGRNTLNTSSELARAAADKAAHMFANDYWAHIAPDGTEPWFFISKTGYRYLMAGENLARDFDNSQDVVEAWMNSPSHRDNLLNPKYQDIGVAVKNGVLGDTETTLVVQMFAARLPSGNPAPKPQTRGIVAQAEAAETPPREESPNSPVNTLSPFSLTRAVSSLILSFLILLFTVDIIVIWKNKIARITSDSAAHLVFLLTIVISIWLIKSGAIL
jgi:uncharacterized protein YkwD